MMEQHSSVLVTQGILSIYYLPEVRFVVVVSNGFYFVNYMSCTLRLDLGLQLILFFLKHLNLGFF